MKTVKPGKLPGDQLMRGTCLHCGAVVECLKSETQRTQIDRCEWGDCVDCPTEGCGRTISVRPYPPERTTWTGRD